MTSDERNSATVFLGIGSNIGAKKNLRIGLHELRSRYGDVKTSAVYRSAALGFDGADFLNLVAKFESQSTATDICREIEVIHNLVGRDRGSDSNKWESRPLDIDLLLYNDLIVNERPVRVPRRDVLEYSFVLRPLAELAPRLVHPVSGKTLLEHWQEFDQTSHPLEAVDVVLHKESPCEN